MVVNERDSRTVEDGEKMVRSKLYLVAAMLTFLLLVSAFMFNWYFNQIREQEIKKGLLDLQTSISESQLELLYLDEFVKDGCSVLEESRKITIDKLVETNRKLMRYKEYLISDIEFKRLKSEQTILYVKYWMLAIKLRERCKTNVTTILYFFDAYSANSLKQGYVLDSITAQYESNILVVPLDYNFDSGIIKILAAQFNVTKTPTVIINEKIKIDWLASKKEIIDAFTL